MPLLLAQYVRLVGNITHIVKQILFRKSYFDLRTKIQVIMKSIISCTNIWYLVIRSLGFDVLNQIVKILRDAFQFLFRCVVC
jgi:hypothetical protein